MIQQPAQTFNPNFRDDMTLTPYQARELNAILCENREIKYKTKLNALNFYQKDPILQTNASEIYVDL